METIHATPAVALTGPDGRRIPGTERLDPQSPDWVGAVPVGDMVSSIPLVGFDDAPSTPRPATPKTETETPRSEATERLTSTPFTSLTDALDDPAHRALIVEHLRSKGISVPGLTDDTETSADVEPEESGPVAPIPDKSEVVDAKGPREAGDGRNEDDDPVRARARALGIDLEDE